MQDYKNNKILELIREIVKVPNQTDYEINGIDTSRAIYFYRKEKEKFKIIPLGSYTIVDEASNKYLRITDSSLLGEALEFQICYLFIKTSSSYVDEFPEIVLLQEHYNQLYDDFNNLLNQLKSNNILGDTLKMSYVLPQLNEGQVWVLRQGEMKAENIFDLDERLKETLEQFKIVFSKWIDEVEKPRFEGFVDEKIQIANDELDSKTELEKIELEDYTEQKKNELDIYLTGRKPIQYATIAELQASTNLKIGDYVEVAGYYTVGDGANHKRIISDTDDGSGVQLTNGLWANIVHNGEVNVSWFGAKGNTARDTSSGDDVLKIIRGVDDTPFIEKAVAYCSRDFGNTLNEKWPDFLNIQKSPVLIFGNKKNKLNYEGFRITKTIPIGAKLIIDFNNCYVIGDHNDYCFGLTEQDTGTSVEGFIFRCTNLIFEGPKFIKLNTRWEPSSFNNWGGKTIIFENCNIKSEIAMSIDAQSNIVAINRCEIIGLIDVVSDDFSMFQTYLNIKPPFDISKYPEMLKFRGSKMYISDTISIPFYDNNTGNELAHIGIYTHKQPGHQETSFVRIENTNFGGEASGYSCINLKTKFIKTRLNYQSGATFENCSMNSIGVPQIRVFNIPNMINISNCRGGYNDTYLVSESVSFDKNEIRELLDNSESFSNFSFWYSGNSFGSSNTVASFASKELQRVFSVIESIKTKNCSFKIYDYYKDEGSFFSDNYIAFNSSSELRVPGIVFKDKKLKDLLRFEIEYYCPNNVEFPTKKERRVYSFDVLQKDIGTLSLNKNIVSGVDVGRGRIFEVNVISVEGVSYKHDNIPIDTNVSYISVRLENSTFIPTFENTVFYLGNIKEHS